MELGIQELKVKCDEQGCGWSQALEPGDLKFWHQTPCPNCGKGVIVSDRDLSLFRWLRLLLDLDRFVSRLGFGTPRRMKATTAGGRLRVTPEE